MKLIFNSPDVSQPECLLAEGTTKVGRADDNNLVIRSNSVSSHHCDILVHGPEVIVRDNQSANGTWVAGQRVNGQTPVRNGETIRFGSVEAVLRFPEETPQADMSTAVTAVWSLKELEKKQEAAAPGHVTVQTGDATVTQTVMTPRPPAASTAPVPSSATPPPPRRGKPGMWLVIAAVLAIVAYLGWRAWQGK